MDYYGYSQPYSASVIHVQSEQQAREWNLAPNAAALFVDDNKPYCYTKQMGNSILQPPIFKRYKMVEEPLENYQVQEQNVSIPKTDYLTKSDFEPYKAIIDEMQKIVKELNGSGESS